jgi:hypothetical protein
MNQPQLQSALYYIYVFSLFSTVAHAMNMISGLWARLLYLMIVNGSGSNLANTQKLISFRYQWALDRPVSVELVLVSWLSVCSRIFLRYSNVWLKISNIL